MWERALPSISEEREEIQLKMDKDIVGSHLFYQMQVSGANELQPKGLKKMTRVIIETLTVILKILGEPVKCQKFREGQT